MYNLPMFMITPFKSRLAFETTAGPSDFNLSFNSWLRDTDAVANGVPTRREEKIIADGLAEMALKSRRVNLGK